MINQWLEIHKTPPPLNVRVLLSDGDQTVIGQCFDATENEFLFALDDQEDYQGSERFKFWMPLPEKTNEQKVILYLVEYGDSHYEFSVFGVYSTKEQAELVRERNQRDRSLLEWVIEEIEINKDEY